MPPLSPRLQALALALQLAAWLGCLAVVGTLRATPEPPPALPSIACAWRCPAT